MTDVMQALLIGEPIKGSRTLILIENPAVLYPNVPVFKTEILRRIKMRYFVYHYKEVLQKNRSLIIPSIETKELIDTTPDYDHDAYDFQPLDIRSPLDYQQVISRPYIFSLIYKEEVPDSYEASLDDVLKLTNDIERAKRLIEKYKYTSKEEFDAKVKFICEEQNALQCFFDYTLLPEDRLNLEPEVKEFFSKPLGRIMPVYASIMDIPILNRLTKELKKEKPEYNNIIIYEGDAHAPISREFISKYFYIR